MPHTLMQTTSISSLEKNLAPGTTIAKTLKKTKPKSSYAVYVEKSLENIQICTRLIL